MAFAGFLAVRSFWAAAAFLALAGLAGGSFLQLQGTTMQRHAPDHLIGRISAAYSSITMAMTLIGALLAAITVNWIGRTETMAFAITAIGCGAAAALRLPARRAAAAARKGHGLGADDAAWCGHCGTGCSAALTCAGSGAGSRRSHSR